ncbi:MAG: MerR family transcriptional regulator [Atribacterota bacterium]|nr:MerR family transcriptional regulator [Atribacterota bacterium]
MRILVLARCRRCGKVFNKVIEKDICPVCLAEEEKEFQRVKSFFREHPRARLEEASRETGVEKKVIMQFLKDGRLQLALPAGETLEEGLFCERCGKPILQGKLCEECKKKLSLLIAQGSKEGPNSSPGFYFKDAIEKKLEKR